MHGVRREFKEEKDDDVGVQRIREYRALLGAFNQDPSLTTSSTLLLVNPECYPAWNCRKRELGREGMSKERLGVELALTTSCIKSNPKSYATWYHRRWVIEQVAGDDKDVRDVAGLDLKLTEKLLSLDSRNFHCWNYRLFLWRGFGLPSDKELEFTTRMIRSNFSNRSAWHYRSLILDAISASDRNLLMQTMDSDFDLIRSAIWTAPSDETPWRHYRWLIDHYAEYRHNMKSDHPDACSDPEFIQFKEAVLKRELKGIKELLGEEPSAVHAHALTMHIHGILGMNEEAEGDRQCLETLDSLRRGMWQVFEWKRELPTIPGGGQSLNDARTK